MNNKIKSIILGTAIIVLTSIGESLFPIFPFIALGCYGTFVLGRWSKDNGV